MAENDGAALRQKMVDEQIKRRGITDQLVISSLLTVLAICLFRLIFKPMLMMTLRCLLAMAKQSASLLLLH